MPLAQGIQQRCAAVPDFQTLASCDLRGQSAHIHSSIPPGQPQITAAARRTRVSLTLSLWSLHMGARTPGYFPGEAELRDVTNILVSAFQKCIKTYSCQISLERASYEWVTCFLKAELWEQRLYRTKHLRSHSQQLLLFSVVHASRPWVVWQREKEANLCSSRPMGPLGVSAGWQGL